MDSQKKETNQRGGGRGGRGGRGGSGDGGGGGGRGGRERARGIDFKIKSKFPKEHKEHKERRDKKDRKENAFRDNRYSHLDELLRVPFDGDVSLMLIFSRKISELVENKHYELLISSLGDFEKGGLNRLNEIARFVTEVDGPKTFQKVTIPIIKNLTRPALYESTLKQEVDRIYLKFESSDFFENSSRCVQKIVDTKGTASNLIFQKEHNAVDYPTSIRDVFVPLVRLVSKIYSLHRAAIANELFAKLVMSLHYLYDCEINSQSQTVNKDSSDDMWREARSELKFLITKLEDEKQTLAPIPASHSKFAEKQGTPIEKKPHPVLMQYAMEYGPGELRAQGPRHDNDNSSIEFIKTQPTESELLCEDGPYLPRNSIDYPHHLPPGFDRHLDIQFRLFRYDVIGPLSMIVQDYSKRLKKNSVAGGTRWTATDGYTSIHYFIYNNVAATRSKGSELVITFQQAPNILKKNEKQRQIYWDRSKRLETGSVISFCWKNAGCPVTWQFAKVVYRDSKMMKDDRPQLNISLLNPDLLNEFVEAAKSSKGMVMIASNSGFFESYFPVLDALKGLYGQMIPLSRLLIQGNSLENKAVGCPKYLDFIRYLDFSKITLNPSQSFRVDLRGPFPSDLLMRSSTLDATQIDAIRTCLTQELALVQGPPGTGKSYVGIQLARILVANVTQFDLPILCVCYTNHALDQFLEELIKNGINNLIRIGGRSKSKILEDKNLITILKAGDVDRFSKPKKRLNQCYWETKQTEIQIQEDIATLALEKLGWEHFKDEIQKTSPHMYTSLRSGEDREGYSTKGRNKKEKGWDLWVPIMRNREVRDVRKDKNSFSNVNELLNKDPWHCNQSERAQLYHFWHTRIIEGARNRLKSNMLQHSRQKTELEHLQAEERVNFLKKAHVVGMTTSGVAKNQKLIHRLQPKVIICEEAAEVLEPHILACLSKSTQHLILIGDHLQLRPKCEVYHLSADSKKGYDLDISLFERLVTQCRIPITTLETQRRMHPSISEIVRRCLYPRLKDSPSVTTYPPVRGVASNLWFMTHSVHESNLNEESQSKTNAYEVDLIKEFVRYLLLQGYKPGEVTVLTPYLGQLVELRSALSKTTEVFVDDRDLEELEKNDLDAGEEEQIQFKESSTTFVTKDTLLNRIRISTVDNFQGEESEVIVISLVRSNPNNSIGFLKINNRVNVMLSRAKHGMYIFGNSSMLETSRHANTLWPVTLEYLRQKNAIGDYIPLVCQLHPKTNTDIREPSEFRERVFDGGCTLLCGARLPKCGHACPRRCHPDDRNHVAAQCKEKCPRIRPKSECEFEHDCKKKCYEECGPCMERIKFTPPCGHATIVACSLRDEHQCTTPVNYLIRKCGHESSQDCWKVQEGVITEYDCRTPCDTPLECRHLCQRMCGQCVHRASAHDDQKIRKKPLCKSKCDRNLFCGHSCAEVCHPSTDCPPCKTRCTVHCAHSECKQECSVGCAICNYSCVWNCDHEGSCKLPCGAPCSRLPCDLQCDKFLTCGHMCPSVCGEKCPTPDFCIYCAKENVQGKEIDFINLEDFKDYYAPVVKGPPNQRLEVYNLDPIIILECKCVYTLSSMDNLMELEKFYEKDQNSGKWTGLKPLTLPSGAQYSAKTCPNCRKPIAGIQRYGRQINRVMIDVTERKFALSFKQEISALKDELQKVQNEVNEAISIKKGGDSKKEVPSKDKKKIMSFNQRGDSLLKKFREHPVRKTYEATVARLKQNNLPHDMNDLIDVPVVDSTLSLEVQMLQADASALGLIFKKNQPQEYTKTFKKYELIKQSANDSKSYSTAIMAVLRIAKLFMIAYQFEQFESEDSSKIEKKRVLDLLDDAKNRAAKLQMDKLHEEIKAIIPQLIKLDRQELFREIFQALKGELSSKRGGFGAHWYKCPNGHYYGIGECGGAMQQSKCPECGATIGGGNHRLAEGNTEANDFLEAVQGL